MGGEQVARHDVGRDREVEPAHQDGQRLPCRRDAEEGCLEQDRRPQVGPAVVAVTGADEDEVTSFKSSPCRAPLDAIDARACNRSLDAGMARDGAELSDSAFEAIAASSRKHMRGCPRARTHSRRPKK